MYSFLVVLLAPHHSLVKTEDLKTSFFGFLGAKFLCLFRKRIFCVLFKWRSSITIFNQISQYLKYESKKKNLKHPFIW